MKPLDFKAVAEIVDNSAISKLPSRNLILDPNVSYKTMTASEKKNWVLGELEI